MQNKSAEFKIKADPCAGMGKAASNDFVGRFREVISDPLNLIIARDPRAGVLNNNQVYLHNGLRVPCLGANAYYGDFSSILVINRGVHEPLEEYVFQELLKKLPDAPQMIELGAYWGHYSMWLKLERPNAKVCLVEPELKNIRSGIENFKLNGFEGDFIQAFVGAQGFGVDRFLAENGIDRISVLHSDIQGYELEMLEDCTHSLTRHAIDYVFVSTHSQKLHQGVIKKLESLDYRVEVSSDFLNETTSYDGFIFASSVEVEPVFEHFIPMSRAQITQAGPDDLVRYLSDILQRSSKDGSGRS